MSARRALLFMPGNDRHKIEKAAALGVDSVIMDLEDGVALSAKADARAGIAAALREIDFGRTEKLVRINAVSRDAFPEADIVDTIDAHPDGYVIPKVENASQLVEVSERLTAAERRNEWKPNSLVLLAIIETALGVLNVREITESSPRLAGLIFGAEDLTGDMGAIRTREGYEVGYARSVVVLHAKAFGLQAIDTPFIHLNDADGLTADTNVGLHMGYSGKLAIHPAQVEPIQRVFTPTVDQIQAAQRLIQAHDEHQAAGLGVFALDDKMVDMPMVRAAQAVLNRAKASGWDFDAI